MNCPHHIQIYKHEMRSYRELPLRLAEFGMVYRFEQSGELNGLLRTRDFTVDDSHIFVPPEGVEAAQLKEVDVRVEVDMRRERMNAKVRDAQMQKIPYMLVIGDREMAEDTVSVRLRTNENWGEMSFVSFLEKIMLNVKRKSESL